MGSTVKVNEEVSELRIMVSDKNFKILLKAYGENVMDEEFPQIFHSIIEDIMQMPLDKLPEFTTKASKCLLTEGDRVNHGRFSVDFEPELKKQWATYGKIYYSVYSKDTEKDFEEYATIILSKLFAHGMKKCCNEAEDEGISIRSYFDRKISSRPDRKEVVGGFLSKKLDVFSWSELRLPRNSKRDIKNAFFKELCKRKPRFEICYRNFRKSHKNQYPEKPSVWFDRFYNDYYKNRCVPYEMDEKKARGKEFADACINQGII